MKEVGHELNSEQKRKNLSLDFIITKIFFIFVPMIDIVQIMGMVFVGVIMVCLALTIVEYITTSLEKPTKRNHKVIKKKRQ